MESRFTAEQILADLTKASEGIYYLSESDFPFVPVTATLGAGQTITEAVVREELASVIMRGSRDRQAPRVALLDVKDMAGVEGLRGQLLRSRRPGAMVELCGKTRNLEQVLESDLTDLHVVFGKKGKAGNVTGVAVSIVIVGLTPDGKLAGVRTIAIWT